MRNQFEAKMKSSHPLATVLLLNLVLLPVFSHAQEDDDPLVDEPAPGAAGPGAQADPKAAPKDNTGDKVLVLPLQAIYRTVPQEKLDAATALLQKELDERDGLVVVRGAVAAAGEAASNGGGAAPEKTGPSVEAAQAAVKAAADAEAGKKIGAAIEAWRSAIAEYEKNAGALDDVSPYIIAHHYLARAQLMAGKDEDAKQTIDVAARMEPKLELGRTEFSRLYRKWFKEAADKALAEKRGQLMVKSLLPGAMIELDGREMSVAPVLLENIVPGKHLIIARLEGVTPFAAAVNITAGGKADLIATYSNTLGGSAVGRVTDALAQNALPKEAIASAAEAGKAAGARWVVFGAMAKDEDRFHVHTYVVDPMATKLAPLEAVSFDLELLTAESDVLRVAQNAESIIRAFPAGGQGALPIIEKRVRVQDTVNKVDASPDATFAEAHTQPGQKKPTRKTVFKPLKGGTIKIKDELE